MDAEYHPGHMHRQHRNQTAIPSVSGQFFWTTGVSRKRKLLRDFVPGKLDAETYKKDNASGSHKRISSDEQRPLAGATSVRGTRTVLDIVSQLKADGASGTKVDKKRGKKHKTINREIGVEVACLMRSGLETRSIAQNIRYDKHIPWIESMYD